MKRIGLSGKLGVVANVGEEQYNVAVLIKNESAFAKEQLKNVHVKEIWLIRSWIAIYPRYALNIHQ